MNGFSTFASVTVPLIYAPQSLPFQNSAIAHRLPNQEGGRRPREPRFAQSSRVLSFQAYTLRCLLLTSKQFFPING